MNTASLERPRRRGFSTLNSSLGFLVVGSISLDSDVSGTRVFFVGALGPDPSSGQSPVVVGGVHLRAGRRLQSVSAVTEVPRGCGDVGVEGTKSLTGEWRPLGPRWTWGQKGDVGRRQASGTPESENLTVGDQWRQRGGNGSTGVECGRNGASEDCCGWGTTTGPGGSSAKSH